MKVLVGHTPTVGIDVSGPPACVRDCAGGAAQDKHGVSRFSQFMKKVGRPEPEFQSRIGGESVGREFGLGMGGSEKSESLSESSSIGQPGDSEDNDDVVSRDGESEEVQSNYRGCLGSLASLEESLPIKRGLSNCFSGKSKSFGNLSEVNTVKDLEKQENPFNKRRRTVMASKWARKSYFYSWSNPAFMPLLALNEEDKEEEEEEEEKKQEEKPKLHERKCKSFKSSSCFSLTDLQEQHHA